MTQSLLQPWHNLAELSGGKGVRAEWNSFPEELLILTNEQASSVPCNSRSGCYMNVVRHGSVDIVGICTSEARQCDRRKLNKTDLAIYRINYQKLAANIAEAIGFTEQLEQIKGQAALWKLGSLNPQAEHSFPVYCFLGQTCSQVEKAVNHLCLTHDSPFVMITSLNKLVNNTSFTACGRHKSKLICIEDILNIDINGRVAAKDSAQTIIANWLDTVLPKSAKPGSEYKFPTPAGATWENFVFDFTATEMLLVKCGQIHERLEPEHLKMKNRNSGKPTLQWTLLRSLAKTGGSISWQDQDATDRIKKQKQELANKLKQTFQLSDDPMPWDEREKCYKSRFTIKAADNVLRQIR